jgi:hypothetical protein
MFAFYEWQPRTKDPEMQTPKHNGGKMKIKLARVSEVAILSLLLIGIGIAASTSAAAQRRNRWDGYPNWGGSYQLRETALNAGYNEGQKQGRDDRSHNHYRDASEFSQYRDGNHDYKSSLGDRDLYRRYYQLAFENGYKTENPNNYNNRSDRTGRDDRDRNNNNDNNNRWGRDWTRYGQFGGSGQMRQTALNAGYNAGNKLGRDDARRGRHRNYNDISEYRNATTDYNSKQGDRGLYQRYYRQGFENGYEDGYRGY